MAKTLDERVAETLGQQVLMILRMETDNEALRAKVAELTPKDPPPAQP